ncbi:MAG TPA: substrate-binding domain-containing protein [Sphingomonas sp.]|nr:substrate-binding domain-containing protein [Sphingomonas sp.]
MVLGLGDAFAEWPDFTQHPLWELKAVLFGRKGHPLLAETPITRDKVARYEIVSPSESRPYGALIRSLYDGQGIDWRKRVHIIDYFPVVGRLVESSDALGVVAASYANTSTFRKRFQAIEGFSLWGPAHICYATRARSEPGPITRAFIAAMRNFGDPIYRPLANIEE